MTCLGQEPLADYQFDNRRIAPRAAVPLIETAGGVTSLDDLLRDVRLCSLPHFSLKAKARRASRNVCLVRLTRIHTDSVAGGDR